MMKKLKSRLRKKIVREHLKNFLEQHRTDSQVLDLGCGRSRYTELFPNRIGFDITRDRGVDVVGDAHHLPFRSGQFSTVLATEMLEHVVDPQRVVSEMLRVARVGGKVILTTRFVFPIHEAPHDYFRFTKYGLAHLFRNCPDVQIQQEASSFETIAILLQRIAYQSDFHGATFTKGMCLLSARFLRIGNRLLKGQYGSYNRKQKETDIMPSGYYVVATKQSGN